MTDEIERLGELYGAWWIDFLGEHCHVGGLDSTRWLLDRAALGPGDRVLDVGAFVGGTARLIASEVGCRVAATDANSEFLAAGRRMPGGGAVDWAVAASQRLPFRDGAFTSVWSMDAFVAPREFSRVAAASSSLCLCTETPDDGRGGVEAFLDEWAEFGWRLAAHRTLSLDALQAWRSVETNLVGRRSYYEPRYGKRSYLAQLDLAAELVRAYSLHERGHALFVFRRGG